jgi:hypothetical protein
MRCTKMRKLQLNEVFLTLITDAGTIFDFRQEPFLANTLIIYVWREGELPVLHRAKPNTTGLVAMEREGKVAQQCPCIHRSQIY